MTLDGLGEDSVRTFVPPPFEDCTLGAETGGVVLDAAADFTGGVGGVGLDAAADRTGGVGGMGLDADFGCTGAFGAVGAFAP